MDVNIKYLKKALSLAYIAQNKDEVPVGAIIVKNGKIIGKGYNQKDKRNISTKHAEIIAIEQACRKLNSWHLDDCILYVTLEPCMMCAGAIIQSRIKKVVFGALSYQDGSLITKIDIHKIIGLNHYPEVIYCQDLPECSKIITNYFKSKR